MAIRARYVVLAVLLVAACTAAPAVTQAPTATIEPVGTPSARPVATPSARPTATPSRPSPTTEPTVAPPTAEELDWVRITAAHQPDLAERGTSVFLRSIASRGQDLVAVGEKGGLGAIAVHSTDGYHWTRAADVPAARDSRMNDVAATDTGYVAVGVESGAGAAWTSADGRTWVRAGVADAEGAILRQVVAWGSGFVALGGFENEGVEAVAFWSSPDGTDWQSLATRGAVVGAGHGLAAVGDRLVLVGESFDQNGGWRATAWTSDEGAEWTQARRDGRESAMRDVVAASDGLVAVGYVASGLLAPAVWRSVDGTAWDPVGGVPGAAENRDAFPTAVSAGLRGVVAVGPSSNGSVGVWTSDDGVRWTVLDGAPGLDSPPDTLGTYEPADVVAGGPGTVVVGWYPRQDPGHTYSGAAWVNPAPPEGSLPEVGEPAAECPSGRSPDLIAVIEMEPQARPECFKGRELRFTAHVNGVDGVGYSGEPEWLLGIPGLELSAIEGGQDVRGAVIFGHVEPELVISEERFLEHRWYVVTGHFGDPRAESCMPTAEVGLTVEEAIALCRQHFVVTGLEPTDPPG